MQMKTSEQKLRNNNHVQKIIQHLHSPVIKDIILISEINQHIDFIDIVMVTMNYRLNHQFYPFINHNS